MKLHLSSCQLSLYSFVNRVRDLKILPLYSLVNYTEQKAMASHSRNTVVADITEMMVKMLGSIARHGEKMTVESTQELTGIFVNYAEQLETIEGRNGESIKALLREADVAVTPENLPNFKKLFKKASLAIAEELANIQMRAIAEARAQEDLDSLVEQMRRDLNEGRRSSARLAKRPRT